jgi:hypothetical protein
MTQQTLRLRRTIDAGTAAVWDVLTDLTRAPQRLSGVTSVQIMTPGPYAVGTRWRETRTFFGRPSTEEMWVRDNHPLRRTVVEAGQGDTTYRTVWELIAAGEVDDEGRSDTTELTVAFTGTVSDSPLNRAAMSVLGPLGLRATRRSLEKDLDDIADAARQLHREHPAAAAG